MRSRHAFSGHYATEILLFVFSRHHEHIVLYYHRVLNSLLKTACTASCVLGRNIAQ